ncbi:MAG: 50S ribosomal protein L39e [Candidatus Heimdallarchaeota archaeon]|nr:50S ribosomal protein L39e [Candidatus Heimdallarchaeota archaeon]MCK4955240.1 50S ribosomal protein L39e [Candidatus Heimdallarchaeota archaeon]
MARYRNLSKKIRYGKELKSNSPVPSWCVIRTNRRFRNHPKRRKWRSTRIKR